MTKSRNKQRENRRKFTKKDRLNKTTIASIKDLTPYYCVYNMTINPQTEEARYL